MRRRPAFMHRGCRQMPREKKNTASATAVGLLAFLLTSPLSHASASSLFDETTIVEFELAGPLGSLIAEDDPDSESPFTVKIDGNEQAVKVQVRGNSRRRVCRFPPLRLNFPRDQAEQSVFAGQDKLKLVTHCRDSDAFTSYLLKEYAVYKIFNAISDAGYRVRLARVTYTDTDGKLKGGNTERLGFLIESEDDLAARLGGEPVSTAGVALSSLDVTQAAKVFVFQYLVGNTDWSFVTADTEEHCCHNGNLIAIDSRLEYVPYDFDLAGFVNAPYAKPDPSLRISRVRQRLYRGYCIAPDALAEAVKVINSRKDAIESVVRNIPELSPDEVDLAARYVQDYFDEAGDVDKIMSKFERSCLE